MMSLRERLFFTTVTKVVVLGVAATKGLGGAEGDPCKGGGHRSKPYNFVVILADDLEYTLFPEKGRYSGLEIVRTAILTLHCQPEPDNGVDTLQHETVCCAPWSPYQPEQQT